MAMTKAGMAAKIKAAQAAVGDPGDYGSPQLYADACMEALCQGIIEEIQATGQTSTTIAGGSSAGTYIGTVS